MSAKGAAARPMLVETPALSCWFWGSNETTTLTIGAIEIHVRNDIPAREAFQMVAGLMQSTAEAWQEFALRKAAAYLRGWSLPKALPEDPDEKLTLLRSMRRGQFERLYEAIVKHDLSRQRHVYNGQSHTEAQWAERADKPKGKDGKPLKWADLLAYIDPEVSLEADAWFVTEDAGVTLQLPDNQWVRIKSELTQGEHIQLVASTKTDAEDGASAAGWVGARKLAFYIQDWSLTYPDGRKVAPSLDALAEMDASKFAVLNHTIDAYEKKLKEGRDKSPTGAQ